MKNIEFIKTLSLTAQVVASRGAWKWAQPYRIAYYKAVERKDGGLYWLHCDRSGKLPVRETLGCDARGSQQGKPVTLEQAISQLGKIKVKRLINNGWKFEE